MRSRAAPPPSAPGEDAPDGDGSEPRRRLRIASVSTSAKRAFAVAALAVAAAGVVQILPAAAANHHQVAQQVAPPATDDTGGDTTIDINLPSSEGGEPSPGVVVILMVTVLSVAPALVVMLTGFTRIIVVLSLTRNALGLQAIPPNQVLAGLALFLSIFVMFPTLDRVNTEAIQPLMDGQITQEQAYDRAVGPIKSFMLKQTRKNELNLFISESGRKPEQPKNVPMSTLIPAFVLSELKTAFIIGFVIFVPFLVVDLIVSSALMSMGMFMLPPVLVSLPFKLLLFVLVDGWNLVVSSIIESFR